MLLIDRYVPICGAFFAPCVFTVCFFLAVLSIRFYAASQRLNRQLAASKLFTLKAIFQGGRISISGRVSVIRHCCSSPQSHTHSHCSKRAHVSLHTQCHLSSHTPTQHALLTVHVSYETTEAFSDINLAIAYIQNKYIQCSVRC